MKFRQSFLYGISFLIGLALYLLIGFVVIIPLAQITGIVDVPFLQKAASGIRYPLSLPTQSILDDKNSCRLPIFLGAYLILAYQEAKREVENDERDYNQAQVAQQRDYSRIKIQERRLKGRQLWQQTTFSLYELVILYTTYQFTGQQCTDEYALIRREEFSRWKLSYLADYADRFMSLASDFRKYKIIHVADLEKDVAKGK
jgi:hypothetical protein